MQKGREEQEESEGTIGSLIWETVSGVFFNNTPLDLKTPEDGPQISEVNERKFLLLSWWIIHRGWRQIGHMIQQIVEESLAS